MFKRDKIQKIVFDVIRKFDKNTELSYTITLDKIQNLNKLDLIKSLEQKFKIKFDNYDIKTKFKAGSWIMEITQLIEKLTRKEMGDWERYIFRTK